MLPREWGAIEGSRVRRWFRKTGSRTGRCDLLAPCPSRISMEKWQVPQAPLGPLSALKSHGFDTLLQGLFWDLKVAAAPALGPPRLRAGGGVGGCRVEGGAWGRGQTGWCAQARGRGGLDLPPTMLAWSLASEGRPGPGGHRKASVCTHLVLKLAHAPPAPHLPACPDADSRCDVQSLWQLAVPHAWGPSSPQRAPATLAEGEGPQGKAGGVPCLPATHPATRVGGCGRPAGSEGHARW